MRMLLFSHAYSAKPTTFQPIFLNYGHEQLKPACSTAFDVWWLLFTMHPPTLNILLSLLSVQAYILNRREYLYFRVELWNSCYALMMLFYWATKDLQTNMQAQRAPRTPREYPFFPSFFISTTIRERTAGLKVFSIMGRVWGTKMPSEK